MYRFLAIFLLASVNLSAVEVYFSRINEKRAAVIDHKPQDPRKFPGHGKKKDRQKEGRGRDGNGR